MKNKVILKYDCDLYDDLSEYLMNLKGINNVIVNNDETSVDIFYDSNIIGLYVIIREIQVFLMIDKIPSLICFDKCSNSKLNEYEINIKDLCCEYCLKGYIEELLIIDGIEKAYSDFNNINKENVKIHLNYDNKLISIDEIKELENKFNYDE